MRPAHGELPALRVTPEPPHTSSPSNVPLPKPRENSTRPAGRGGARPGSPRCPGEPRPAEEKAHEREELYEYFLDRFKRDLPIEREQMGHLIIDNP